MTNVPSEHELSKWMHLNDDLLKELVRQNCSYTSRTYYDAEGKPKLLPRNKEDDEKDARRLLVAMLNHKPDDKETKA